MRIGVACEGRTDYPAVVHFLAFALSSRGISAEFIPLYPKFDQTRPEGGWSNVLLWLQDNPPDFRVQNYFSGGLFGGDLFIEPLDAIVMQLDADVVEDESFIHFAQKNYSINVSNSDDPVDRGSVVRSVIEAAARKNELCEADARRHISAPSVEATETWCVAAFNNVHRDWEYLRGADLANSFMSALEQSEGRVAQDSYANISKDYQRRAKFCKTHESGAIRILATCSHFERIIDDITALVQ